MLTLDGETALSGKRDAAAAAAHWTALSCTETVDKLGAAGCRLPGGPVLLPPDVLERVDTGGAGDAFNGGYLSAQLNGASIRDAPLEGHRLAGWCVMRRCAIPGLDQDAATWKACQSSPLLQFVTDAVVEALRNEAAIPNPGL